MIEKRMAVACTTFTRGNHFVLIADKLHAIESRLFKSNLFLPNFFTFFRDVTNFLERWVHYTFGRNQYKNGVATLSLVNNQTRSVLYTLEQIAGGWIYRMLVCNWFSLSGTGSSSCLALNTNETYYRGRSYYWRMGIYHDSWQFRLQICSRNS